MGEDYYEILKNWIAGGAKLELDSPRVTGIELSPKNPVVQKIGDKQQMRVIATYANGEKRDVTAESFIETGNSDIATTDKSGLVNTARRGEAPMLARFEGAYASTIVTVMGDRSGFEWKDMPTNNKVDEFVADKLKRTKTLPSEIASDEEFLRRIHLDLTGLPPTAEDVLKFGEDNRSSKIKRDELIDKLVGNDDYIDHWTNKWADLLLVNRKFLGTEGSADFETGFVLKSPATHHTMSLHVKSSPRAAPTRSIRQPPTTRCSVSQRRLWRILLNCFSLLGSTVTSATTTPSNVGHRINTMRPLRTSRRSA